MAKTLVGALRVTLGLDSVEFERGATRAQAAARRLGQNLQRIGAAMSIVGAGISLAIKGQLNQADAMGKMAAAIGVPVEQLSTLAYAADLSGVSIEQLRVALGQLAKRLVDNEEDFTDLGIAVRDANGEMRPVRDVLDDLATRFKNMPDGAQKTAEAMRLLGRSGAEMIPLLNEGADGLKVLTDEARRLGLEITDETSGAAATFNDNLSRLGATMTGLVRVVTANLAPVLARLSDAVVRMAAAFQDLSPHMQQILTGAAALTVVLGPMLIGLGLTVAAVSAISAPALLAAAGLGALIVAAPTLRDKLRELVPEVVAVTDRIGELVRQGAASAPTFLSDIGNIFSNFGTALHILLQDSLGAVAADMTALGDAMRRGAADGVQWVKDQFTALLDWLRGLPGMFAEVGRNIIQGLVNGITERWETLKATIVGLGQSLPEWIKGPLGIQSPSTVFAEIGRYLAEGLGLGIQSGRDMVGQAVQGLADTAKGAADGFSTVGSQMENMFSNAFTSIVTGSQSAGDAIRGLLSQLASMAANAAFKTLFSGMFKDGGFLSGIIPGLATGTASAKAGLTMVGEQGPELVAFGGGERVFNAGQTARMLNQGPATPEVKFSNINVLDPSIVGQFMATPEGRRATVNVLRMEGLLGA